MHRQAAEGSGEVDVSSNEIVRRWLEPLPGSDVGASEAVDVRADAGPAGAAGPSRW